MAKIALVGDIHLSPKCDITSIKNHVVAGQKKFLDGLAAKFTESGVDTILFAGDTFSVRPFVSVESLNYAMELFGKTLGKFDIHIIAGNHDCLYDNTNAVSSIRYLGMLPNVHVYIDKPETIELHGMTFHMVPWVTPAEMPGFVEWLGKLAKKPKKDREKTVIFGHFDMMGVLQDGGRLSDVGLEPDRFLKAAKYTFSGHYHCRSTTEKNGNSVVYLGTPYQLTFAHVGTDCGHYLFDDEMNLEFIENTESPRFTDCDDEHLDGLGDLHNYFVRYMAKIGRSQDESSDLKKKLEAYGPLYIKMVPYGGEVGTIGEVKKMDDAEAKTIMDSDMVGLASFYMDKYADSLPTFSDGGDARGEILGLLQKYIDRIG